MADIKEKVSRLTFIRETVSKHPRKGLYGCTCGNKKEIYIASVKSGNTKSCGCYKKEAHYKHGLYKHLLHSAWVSMTQRCYNINHLAYPYYGGMGVTVCNEWRGDFIAFYNWAMSNGWKKGLQLDKDKKSIELGITPNLYSPERCQFITPKLNGQFRKNSFFIEYNGETKTIQQWAEKIGINHNTLRGRIRHYGWSIEKAFTTKK
jgi:hypothetical protein